MNLPECGGASHVLRIRPYACLTDAASQRAASITLILTRRTQIPALPLRLGGRYWCEARGPRRNCRRYLASKRVTDVAQGLWLQHRNENAARIGGNDLRVKTRRHLRQTKHRERLSRRLSAARVPARGPVQRSKRQGIAQFALTSWRASGCKRSGSGPDRRKES